MNDPDRIVAALGAPFEAGEVKFKAQVVSGNRALAVPYVDARVVQDRLDDVLGLLNWSDSYECFPDGSVLCRLRVRIGGEWITKEDVGGQSEQPDEGDRRKAAVSDALKRAAVKFGVARYLYRQKPQWVDYDPQKQRFVTTPTLPVTPPAEPPPAASTILYRRLAATNRQMVAEGLCGPKDLQTHLKARLGARYPGGIKTWPESAAADVAAECQAFRKLREGCAAPSAQQLSKLNAELARTGATWGHVRTKLRLPDDTTPNSMTAGQCQEAMDALGEMENASEGAA